MNKTLRMLFKNLQIAVVLLLCSTSLFSQNEPPTITPCDSQFVCLTTINDTIYELCVLIEVDSNFTGQIDSFIIDWGDDSPLQTVPGSMMPGEQFHVYNLKDFYKTCTFSKTFRIDLDTYEAGTPDPLFNGSRIVFRNCPQARFTLESDTICVGDTITLTHDSCPEEQLSGPEWSSNFGIQIAPDQFTYTQDGIDSISLTVRNPCGEGSLTRPLVVLPLPEARAEVIWGTQNNMSPYVVCLGGGGNVGLQGSNSENVDIYEWSTPGSSSTLWVTSPNSPDPTIKFTSAEENPVMVVLTVRNQCDKTDSDTLFFEVIDADLLSLTPLPDTCEQFSYTPDPLVDGAIYTVNGSIIPANNFPITLGNGENTISAFLQNACDTTELFDTVRIAPPDDVLILLPTIDTTVCVGSDSFLILSNTMDGRWMGDHIRPLNSPSTYFYPTEVGTFTVRVASGYGPCERSDEITVMVVEEEVLELQAMPDTCVDVAYTPQPLLANVVYTVNGTIISHNNFPLNLSNGEHIITAELSNECGDQTVADTFNIAPPTDVLVTLPTQDTVVCEGTTRIALAANVEEGQWQGQHISTVNGQFFFTPTEVGIFTLTYVKGNGLCQRSGTATIRVIENVILTLEEMPDTCVSIQYTPQPLLADAVYTVNGTTVPNANFPIELNDGQHIILAELDNECGYQSQPDTFTIAPAVPVTILRPAQDTTVCEGSTPILLGANTDGGQWQGEHIVNNGGQFFFEPNEVGTFTITFVKGNGVCQRSSSMTIRVIENVILTLMEMPDTCVAIQYTPQPLLADAVYTVDGIVVSNANFPIELNNGQHTILAELDNECGYQSQPDTFTIAPAVPVTILRPAQDTTVCEDSTPILLGANTDGGQWQGEHIVNSGGQFFFEPNEVGTFTITFVKGNGVCQRSSSMTIRVIENVILTLMEMPDTCVAIQYTPQPLLADAVYTVNGTMVPNASFPIELNDGQHTILAELDNECGYQSQPDTFIITPAVAVTIVRPAQDTTVCEASMAILLGADTDGGQWQGEHVVNSGGQLFFEPNEAGTFTVAFVKGNGVCQRTDERTITVIPNIMLDLEPTPDTCIELSYTPNPFFSDALYIIDGDTIPNSDFPRPLAFGSHTIEAILSNACGVQTDSDDFLLSPPVEVSITLPTTDTSICLGSAPLLLEADPPGGSFLLPTGEVLGSSTTFSPVDTGTFLIIYRRGNGPCERRDSLWVQVQGVFATIEPLRVCPWSDPQLLVAEPPGGQFFSTDCPACVQGDRFVPANLPGATAVEVFYLVADELGCEDTTSMVVEVLEPQAAFEIVSPLCIGTPLEVDPAAAIGERFLWRVDGQERPGPPFVGLAAGAHTIELVAITAFCRDSTQQTFTLLTPPRSADFSISDEEICPGEGVFFSRTPTPLNDQAGDLTYTWAFGRFVNDTLITPDPLDSIYFENMTDSLVTFRASLTVSNGCGSITQDTLIRVFPEVIADLGIDSTKLGCSPFKVLFTDRSRPRNWIDSCRYDLGDGTIFRTCRDTFSHTFTNDTDSTIAFPVLLTAYGVCNTDYSIDTIRVIPDGVEARFNIEDDQYIVCPNKAIQFTDASTPKPTSWSWDFGDNTRDNVANPIHTFTTGNDTFNIRLRVSTGCGFDQIDRTLITLPEPLVDFIAPEYTCEGAPIQGLENRSPEDHEAYYWDYGNGQRDSNVYQPAPPPVYTEAGTRATIRLEVVDFPNQCTNSLEKTVLIRHQPRPVLDSLDRIVCPGSNLTLEVDTVGWFANQLIWEHKGRVISEQTLFSTDFGDPGADSIVLIASYDGVCVDSVLRFLEVKNCDLYIPNAFTPNNDGNNDHFTVYAPTGAVEEVGQFRIFDRWGNLLFEANADFQPSADQNADQDQGWDGHFNNEPMNSGVYVYVVKVRFRGRSTFEEFRGTVTLLR